MNAQLSRLCLLVTGVLLASHVNAQSYAFTHLNLDTLGGTNSVAYAINNAGQVAGWATTAGNAAKHATLWNGATAIDLSSFLNADAADAAGHWRVQLASMALEYLLGKSTTPLHTNMEHSC